MSEEDDDLEIIPVLDDIVVAGDLDKAVTGDTDVNNLSSIESFDDLFDTNDNEENNDTSIEATNNPIEPDTTAKTLNTSGNEAIGSDLNDDLFDSIHDEVVKTESVEDDNPLGDKPIESIEDYNALVGANDATESNIDNHDDTPDEPTDETELVNPPVDLNQLVENVIHEIMPTLETQIKALILASLEKHLSDSLDNETEFNESEEP